MIRGARNPVSGPQWDGADIVHTVPASPARMAVLHHLARHPKGATETELALAIGSALGSPLTEANTWAVMQALRRAGRIQSERNVQPTNWFAIGARHAAKVRAGQAPKLAPPRCVETTA